MYLFHIGPEADGLKVPPGGAADEFRRRLDGYGGYVADIAAALTTKSHVVYSPLNELLVPRPWHRRRIVLGGDAAHVVPPHLTQGAAMAVEDAYVLAQCLPASDALAPSALESALRRYETLRYPRAAFVASFAGWWMRTEQSVRSADQLRAISSDWRANMSDRIGASDAILDERPI
jgi:2-polyprenyl-6-methoxyphenol hydroxylase-like FAD-dependent oxidoreductase